MSQESPSSNSSTSGLKLPPWLAVTLILIFIGFAWYQNQQKQKGEQQAREQAELANAHKNVAIAESNRRNDESRTAAEEREGEGEQHVASSSPASPSEFKLPDANEPLSAEVTPETRPATSANKTAPAERSPDKSVSTATRSPTQTRAGPTSPTADRTNPEKPSSSTAKNSKPAPQPSTNPSRSDAGKSVTKSTPDKSDPTGDKWTILENQTIKNFDRVVYRGTIDLKPTIDRIARGERNSHRNDGSTFGNRERRLPQKQSGYYTEYVHPTKGIDGPGPQRVIMGKGGDIWYTPDHYETFKKIK